MEVDIYYNKYLPLAQEVERIYGIPYIVALAQSAIETGWGTSVPGNMYFGFKASQNWTGRKQLLKTTEYHKTNDVVYPQIISIEPLSNNNFKYIVKDWFRAYNSARDSFLDWAYSISNAKRYSQAFKTNNPYLFAAALIKGGYATDPNYYSKISSAIKLIENIKKKTLK